MTKKLIFPSSELHTLRQPTLFILDPEAVDTLKDLAAIMQLLVGVLPEHAIPEPLRGLFKKYELEPPPEG